MKGEKMNKKKLFTGLLCFSMLALAACSGDNKGSSKSGSQPEGSEPEGSEPAHVHTFSDAWSRSNTEHWHQATCGHEVDKDRAPHTVNGQGFCSVCGFYTGELASLKENIAPTIQKGGYAYYRVELSSGEDTHYGLFTDFNELDGNEAKVEYFVFIDKAPHKLGEAKTNETKLIVKPLGTDDNYLYVVYSYTGNAESLTLEKSYVTNLNDQACDDNRWYYGSYNNDLIDSSMFIEGTRINRFCYIAFMPNDPDDYCYEISVAGCLGFEVWQDTGSKLEALEPSGGKYYPVTANEMIIKVETETPEDPGGGTCVTVTEYFIY